VGDLKGTSRGGEIDRGHKRIGPNHEHVRKTNTIAPLGGRHALGREVALALILHREIAAPVHNHIEHPVDVANGVAELGMIDDAHPDARERSPVAHLHIAADGCRSLYRNRAWRDADLRRVRLLE
jgi:hypothetical protein